MTEIKEIEPINIEPLNIYEKMLKIQSELGIVEKLLEVSTGKGSYKAVSERDIIDNVKPLEKKYGIYSYPYSREIVESGTVERTYKETVTKSFFIRAKVTYRFVNTENPREYIDMEAYGDGIDTGDKAPGKAVTYADKYALMKAYKISTGDDPDKDASQEYSSYKKKTTTKKLMTDEQEALIKDLYSADEINIMLERQGKVDLRQFTQDEAIKMIDSRIGIKSTKETF